MTQTFRQAYEVLCNNAEYLREQQEPNIDELLGIVTESVAAYKICKERIDAVEAALKLQLADPAVSASPRTSMSAPSSSPNSAPSSSPSGSASSSEWDDPRGRRGAGASGGSFVESNDDVPF